ncbi:MAG: C39 family peptidase [Anaerolineae bacterium]
MYISRRFILRWGTVFMMSTMLASAFVYFAADTEAINRRLEAVPYYARTYLNKFRPKPSAPPPPQVSTIAPEMLLQARSSPGGESEPASDTPALFNEESLNTTAGTAVEQSPAVPVAAIAPQVSLTGFSHDWQTWNNCGPTTIAMNLSFYGRAETQVESAQFLKPNQDDKNVNPEELAAYARTLGFEATTRVGGNLELLKRLLSNGLPVIVETWLDPEDNGGLGHYRLFSGYDEAGRYFLAQDSLRGPEIQVDMDEFDQFWRVFNRKYVVVYRPEQAQLVQAILGPDAMDWAMLERALTAAQSEARVNPADPFAWFNIGSTYAQLGEPELAASAFDEARRIGLPYRMLWYQFDIFEVYLAVGRYQDVIDLGTATLKATGGLEEIYYYRGLARLAVDQPEAAAADFRAALDYNPNFVPAAEALLALGGSS